MKSSDTYKFTLSWQKDTEEQILAGEFLGKLGNKKSKFIVQLICDYIAAHPEAVSPNETLRFIVNSTLAGDKLTEMIRSMIQSELAGKELPSKAVQQSPGVSDEEQAAVQTGADIDNMFDNLDMWNNT
jgi:hypothetical protein